MSRTKKPCPGCKTTEFSRSSVDDVCYQCERRIKEAVKAEEALARVAKVGKVVVLTNERSYALPGFYGEWLDMPSASRERLQKAFMRIIDLHIEQKLEQYSSIPHTMQVPVPPKKESRHDWSIKVVMAKDAAEAINELHAATMQAIVQSSEECYDRGKDLLLGVAAGTTTVHELNGESVKGSRR